jgi:hypothetical protein
MEPEKIVRLVGWGSLLLGLLFAVPLYTSFFTDHYGRCLALANEGEHAKALECERDLAKRFSPQSDENRPKPAR